MLCHILTIFFIIDQVFDDENARRKKLQIQAIEYFEFPPFHIKLKYSRFAQCQARDRAKLYLIGVS